MAALDFLEDELRSLKAAGLFREPCQGGPWDGVGDESSWLDVTSNDYLGLARAGVSRETLLSLAGTPSGAGASRLVHGTRPQHDDLERTLAAWLATESTLLFSSGYAANLGVLACLPQPDDLIISDALNHASLIDGCRLSKAPVHVVPHLDLNAVSKALQRPATRHWIVTESYFSMDGDTPNLRELRRLATLHSAVLVVDEAHALGLFGPRGTGLCARDDVVPDILVGTLGKALGLHGAFVAGSSILRTYLWNRARPFVYSTAPLPFLAALACLNVARIQTADHLRTHVASLATQLRDRLALAGLTVPPTSHGPIVPLLLGAPHAALTVASRLAQHRILAQPIRPPTVPPGTSRLRITLSAAHTPADIAHLADSLIASCVP